MRTNLLSFCSLFFLPFLHTILKHFFPSLPSPFPSLSLQYIADVDAELASYALIGELATLKSKVVRRSRRRNVGSMMIYQKQIFDILSCDPACLLGDRRYGKTSEMKKSANSEA